MKTKYKYEMLKDTLLSLSDTLYLDLETAPNRVTNDSILRVKPTVKWEKHESQPQWSFPTICTIMCRSAIIVIDNLAIFFDRDVKRHLMSLPVVGHNIFFDLAHLLYQYDMRWTNDKIFCTLIAEKCLTRGLGVKCDLWSSLKRRKVVDLFNQVDDQKRNWLLPLDDTATKYCHMDVQYLPFLMKAQLAKLKKEELIEPMFSHIETMNEVVLDMQLNGMPVDYQYADVYYEISIAHTDNLKKNLTDELIDSDLFWFASSKEKKPRKKKLSEILEEKEPYVVEVL